MLEQRPVNIAGDHIDEEPVREAQLAQRLPQLRLGVAVAGGLVQPVGRVGGDDPGQEVAVPEQKWNISA